MNRLFDSDLLSMDPILSFNGNKYKINTQITAYGYFASQMSDVLMLLAEHDVPTEAIDHYRSLVAKCPLLKHENRQLKDHIKKLEDPSYIVGQVIYLTPHGIDLVSKMSENPKIIRNREQVLALFKQQRSELRTLLSSEELVIKKQRLEMELYIPVLKARNVEEYQHIQNIGKSQADRLSVLTDTNLETLKFRDALMKRIKLDNEEALVHKDALMIRVKSENEEALKHKDALMIRIKRDNEEALNYKDALAMKLTMERDESLRFEHMKEEMETKHRRARSEFFLDHERCKIRLEHDKRMLLDAPYKASFLEMAKK